jgi:hypothetical protein
MGSRTESHKFVPCARSDTRDLFVQQLLYLCFATVWSWWPVISPAPLEESLENALNAQKSQCQAAGRSFYTLDTLVTLLAMPNGRVAGCFDKVKPGWAAEGRTKLQERATNLSDGGYVPFEWADRKEFRGAQKAARRARARAVADVHLMRLATAQPERVSAMSKVVERTRHPLRCRLDRTVTGSHSQ